jgi:uncharacterized protein DUF2630
VRQPTSDERVLGKIRALVHEEQKLYEQGTLSDGDRLRLEQVRVDLDQCWDLLRQRRARREFGRNPGDAQVRPASIVENYEQ